MKQNLLKHARKTERTGKKLIVQLAFILNYEKKIFSNLSAKQKAPTNKWTREEPKEKKESVYSLL